MIKWEKEVLWELVPAGMGKNIRQEQNKTNRDIYSRFVVRRKKGEES